MRVYSYLSLANGKGVHREVESEGSRRQSSGPRNTNIIEGISGLDELATQSEVQKLYGDRGVNDAGTWNESDTSYRGRSHRHRLKRSMKLWLKKICCEKSAEPIVPEKIDYTGKG